MTWILAYTKFASLLRENAMNLKIGVSKVKRVWIYWFN